MRKAHANFIFSPQKLKSRNVSLLIFENRVPDFWKLLSSYGEGNLKLQFIDNLKQNHNNFMLKYVLQGSFETKCLKIEPGTLEGLQKPEKPKNKPMKETNK